MPDWNKYIREQLGPINLPPQAQDEVVRELSVHLLDIYEEKIAAGFCEADAYALTLRQVARWRPLAKQIERAKNKEKLMNARSKQFWLPALLSLATSLTLEMGFQLASTKLQMPWKHAGLAFLPYVLWILLLPGIGAACGYLSIRAGAGRTTRIIAVTFPSVVAAILWIVLAMSLIIRKTPRPFQTLNFTLGFVLSVIVPGIALLAGTLPLSRIRAKDSARIEA